ncbi:MAG: ABC transporter permease [Firmicutes bacterium]|nr:ABC transporter permease [Bacillota bacterium]
MKSYVLRRLIWLIPIMLIVSILSFSIIFLSPGDPAELILERKLQGTPTPEQIAHFKSMHGLDKPIPVQFVCWLTRAIRGDMGTSLVTGEPVFREYINRFGVSLQLVLISQAISIAIAIPLGIVSAVRANSIIDHICRLVAMTGVSLPSFWLALLLIYFFSVRLGWLPVCGYGEPKHIILPAITVGISGAMSLMRLTRASLLEVLRLNYVRTARAKGLPEKTVVTRHALRNAMIPVVTAIGLHFGHVATGMVIVETLFAWPGIGGFLVKAIAARDFPVIQAFVLMGALIFVLLNLAVDVLYACLDPRVSYAAKGVRLK